MAQPKESIPLLAKLKFDYLNTIYGLLSFDDFLDSTIPTIYTDLDNLKSRKHLDDDMIAILMSFYATDLLRPVDKVKESYAQYANTDLDDLEKTLNANILSDRIIKLDEAKLQLLIILECLRLHKEANAVLSNNLPSTFLPQSGSPKRTKPKDNLSPVEKFELAAEMLMDRVCIWDSLFNPNKKDRRFSLSYFVEQNIVDFYSNSLPELVSKLKLKLGGEVFHSPPSSSPVFKTRTLKRTTSYFDPTPKSKPSSRSFERSLSTESRKMSKSSSDLLEARQSNTMNNLNSRLSQMQKRVVVLGDGKSSKVKKIELPIAAMEKRMGVSELIGDREVKKRKDIAIAKKIRGSGSPGPINDPDSPFSPSPSTRQQPRKPSTSNKNIPTTPTTARKPPLIPILSPRTLYRPKKKEESTIPLMSSDTSTDSLPLFTSTTTKTTQSAAKNEVLGQDISSPIRSVGDYQNSIPSPRRSRVSSSPMILAPATPLKERLNAVAQRMGYEEEEFVPETPTKGKRVKL